MHPLWSRCLQHPGGSQGYSHTETPSGTMLQLWMCVCDSYVWLHLNTVVLCVCGQPECTCVRVSFGWCVWVVACLHTPTWTGNSHMSFCYGRWDPSECAQTILKSHIQLLFVKHFGHILTKNNVTFLDMHQTSNSKFQKFHILFSFVLHWVHLSLYP